MEKELIEKGLTEAYKRAGHNAYFGNGFYAGVEFALNQDKSSNFVNPLLDEGFDINTAIEDEGTCKRQKVNCEDCKMGKFIFETNLKFRKDELCKHEIVLLLAKVVKTFA